VRIQDYFLSRHCSLLLNTIFCTAFLRVSPRCITSRFAVKAVEHAQVSAYPTPLNLFPGSEREKTDVTLACIAMSFLILDLLEPAREDPAALFETHKVPPLPEALSVSLWWWGSYGEEIGMMTRSLNIHYATSPSLRPRRIRASSSLTRTG
jgi:hypothetical protein